MGGGATAGETSAPDTRSCAESRLLIIYDQRLLLSLRIVVTQQEVAEANHLALMLTVMVTPIDECLVRKIAWNDGFIGEPETWSVFMGPIVLSTENAFL